MKLVVKRRLEVTLLKLKKNSGILLYILETKKIQGNYYTYLKLKKKNSGILLYINTMIKNIGNYIKDSIKWLW
mgnify:CR=1 FL=1